jgi:hypothetical protein
MVKKIKLGYEVKTGKVVTVQPSHLIVTGVTQQSGKTTTLEALIKRSGQKAIVFKTKIGEKSFTDGTIVPPFFRDRSDYEFVKSLIEAYNREKLFLEKGTLMGLCKGSSSLLDVKKRVDDKMTEGKLRGINAEIYQRLQHYLEQLIPQIQYANFSKTLEMRDGINIMNLERFKEEVQSLIIMSVAEEVLTNHRGIILVIPEAWKFIPQKYNNPCKRVVESFIRQGAASENYIWIDSQDMAGVDKIPLKQLSTWILGYQSERNEVKHTLDQIALPKKAKPTEDEIMNLRKGHFIISSYDGVQRVYVQPMWMDDDEAKKIAMGEIDIATIMPPVNLVAHSIAAPEMTYPAIVYPKEPDAVGGNILSIRRELIEMRTDFFNKIQDLQEQLTVTQRKLYDVEQVPRAGSSVNEAEIISKVLQKMPVQNSSYGVATNLTVAPLEKIKKDFLERAKNRVLGTIQGLSPDEKKILLFIESQGKGVPKKDLLEHGLGLKASSGGNQTKMIEVTSRLVELELTRRDKNAMCYPELRKKIETDLGVHSATPEEINQVYNHVLADVLRQAE